MSDGTLRDLLAESHRDDQGRPMVKSHQGGLVFEAGLEQKVRRFLTIGTEGGSFYVSARELTRQMAASVARMAQEHPGRLLEIVREVSIGGLAPKNDYALFALALLTDPNTVRGESDRAAAYRALPEIARTGTHLLHFAAYARALRGGGPGLNKALGRWFTGRPVRQAAFQVVKYRQRGGWAMRDLLRLARPKPPTPEYNALFAYLIQGWDGADAQGRPVASLIDPDGDLGLIWAFEAAQRATSPAGVLPLIASHGLTWEMLPTELLREASVWEALLPSMGLDAMIRNLGRMTNIGLLAPRADAVRQVVAKLTDQEALRRQRVHPIKVLNALAVYRQGCGVKGSLSWTPVPEVVAGLDSAFYLAYGAVSPMGISALLALDVSGSMGWGGIPGMALNPREISAALAMVAINTDPGTPVIAFTSGRRMNRSGVTPLSLRPDMRLDEAIQVVSELDFGGTDITLPIQFAREQRLALDAIITYTDNEHGDPTRTVHQELRRYRNDVGRATRSIAVAMQANDYTVADPNDPLQLDVAGFSLDTPGVISDFAAGRI